MAWEDVSFVPSSNLHAAIYDADTQQLMIEFKSGAVGRYSNITGDMVEGLSQAISAGKYLQDVIQPMCEYKQIK